MDIKYKAKYKSMSENIIAIEKGDERAIFELIFRMANRLEIQPKEEDVVDEINEDVKVN
jgi:hypothetical protein